MRKYEHHPFATLTTLGTGGEARLLVETETEQELIDQLLSARKSGTPVLVLGQGSNVVAPDEGWPGLVLRPAMRGISVQSETGAAVVVEVAAGESWDEWVERTVHEGWSGLAALSGIPGLVGAAPVQNIGAYGAEMGEFVVAVRVLDRQRMTTEVWPAERCGFAYRSSVLRGQERYVVLSVTFRLNKSSQEEVRYEALARHLGVRTGEHVSGTRLRAGVMEVRREKGMLVGQEPESRTAGSFFVNPVIPRAEVDRLQERLRERGVLSGEERVPQFPVGFGRTKVPAAWLIERAGFPKGTKAGNVGVSSKHALALVNLGGANSSEVLQFAHKIIAAVENMANIHLRIEPIVIRPPDSTLS